MTSSEGVSSRRVVPRPGGVSSDEESGFTAMASKRPQQSLSHFEKPVKVVLQEKMRKSIFIEIIQGNHKIVEVTGAELLSMINTATPREGILSTATYRDIRQLVAEKSRKPSINVRNEAVLLNFHPVVAIVKFNSVLLLVTEDLSVDRLVLALEEVSASYRDGPRLSDPFELNAYENLFAAVFSIFKDEVRELERTFNDIYQRFTATQKQASTKDLQALSELQIATTSFGKKVESFEKAIDALLGDQEDLFGLELTARHLESKKVVSPGFDVLLEFFDRELDHLSLLANELSQNLDSLERMSNLRMAIIRNQILRIDLYASVIGLGLGFGTCLSGMFGMNLLNHWEESNQMFLGITGLVWATVVVCSGGIVYLNIAMGI